MSSVSPIAPALLSVGAVSRETGVAVETLRTWERRYGFPMPERTAGGHRVYTRGTVERLKLIGTAIERGHRPAQVVPLEEETLRSLLGQAPAVQGDEEAEFSFAEPVASWLRAARSLDGETLDIGFRSEWNRHGAIRFLEDRARPFLEAVGVWWADGRIGVLHEHFASERLRDFLAGNWRPISDQQRGPRVICACLPGERHHLTLHMLAIIAAMAGCRVVFLGADTPIDDIVSGARQAESAAVLISVSRAAESNGVTEQLRTLRSRIDPQVEIFVGGAGAPEEVAGTRRLERLDELNRQMQRLVQTHQTI